ncbi:MAG: hypothetical protein F6K19_35700 [Cyanothece sp. SIO1E1]|nr:hypothetical protein [Cyanothece sp. SIO1E1]
MKLALFSLGLFSLAPLWVLASNFNHVASAQCVVSDVAVQVAVHGSRRPARQSNDVDIKSDGPCSGNTSTSHSTQVQVGGTGEVRQERRSRHRLSGGQNNRTGVNGPTVAIPVEVQVNVDNPADRIRY